MRPQEQPGDDGTPRYHAGMESIATRRSRVDEREGSTDGESVPWCRVLVNSLSNGARCKASANRLPALPGSVECSNAAATLDPVQQSNQVLYGDGRSFSIQI